MLKEKKKVYINLAIIIVLALLAGNFVFPQPLNKGIDYFNKKFSLHLPHFFDIPFRLGLDLKGGSRLIYRADLSSINKKDYDQSMQGLRDVIERRVNLFGVGEPVVQTETGGGEYRLTVELAGVYDVKKAIDMIGKTPYLEFKEQRTQEETDKILADQKVLESKKIAELSDAEKAILLTDPYFTVTNLTGRYLKNAELTFDQTTYKPLIIIHFNDDGSKVFETLTEKNVGKPLAIYIDGVLISAPRVQEKIAGGTAQITGSFSITEARELVRNLNAGALPVPVSLISQETVGATLGVVSLEKSLKAAMLGFLAVVIFMIVIYRFSGLLASLALLLYVFLLLTVFKLVPVTLSLAGIGGFVLSIGMAVDANVLIFARMREEIKSGKSFSAAVEEGFVRAWPSIRDSNLTTLIIGFILFFFGTSFVKGFALTLNLGILFSMFSAVFVTKTLLKCFEGTKLEKIKFIWP